jgi:hypothetical protein
VVVEHKKSFSAPAGAEEAWARVSSSRFNARRKVLSPLRGEDDFSAIVFHGLRDAVKLRRYTRGYIPLPLRGSEFDS